ncbi:MAG: HAMP domain-containing sensor histidine kinase [Anaerolineales bacterium]|nr:HAMP domain-containing sensor histidine kinase [Anaerolineales bacterium]
MFTSLRSRLWLSYALIVVTALGVVAMVLFAYLLRNPLLYRQTIQRLKSVETIVTTRDDSRPLAAVAENAARTFDVRILQYTKDGQVIFDTQPDKQPALPLPQKRLLSRVPLARDENGAAWLYSFQKLSDKTILVVASPRPRLSIVNIFADDFLPIILQSGLIALALSLVVAFFVARWIADPLQKVVIAASEDSSRSKPVEARGPHEVRELTRAFNAMVARAQASQKSQRDFVANVSHELKTPLTSVQGFAQALLDGAADTEESRRQAAQIIYDESARMNRMVLDLLDLAKLDAGTADITMSSVNIAALLNTIAEKFAPQSQKAGVKIMAAADSNLPKLSADGDRLAQVFANLVDNALKFTPVGGSITLRASADNREILVSVADTGVGISPEAQARIFDRFYQADPARKGGAKHGAGLGLAIVHEIVQAHGGRIAVRSRLGEGTTFDVFFPYNKSDSHL